MNRPYIICHMMQSLDGRVACDMVDKISGDEYYTALEALDCPSHLEGKRSYQIHYCGFDEFRPSVEGSIDKETFYIASKALGYEISVDTRSTLMWDKNETGARICIMSEQASTEYLEYLKNKAISYITTGKDRIDLPRAMEILYKEFGIERLAIVGGGKVNGGFLSAGLIDEVSVMIAPSIDGRICQPSLFDGIKDEDGYLPKILSFKEVTTFPNGVIWSRYTI